MIAPGSPTVRRRRLAAELRGIRESKGKSGDTVAAALKWSPSKISRYERARTGLRPREVERLLDYYEITGPRRALLLGLAEDAAQKGWWEEFTDSLSEDYKQFIGLEHEATSMAIWHVDVVTGLLQTEEYARHIIGSYSRVEPVAPGMIGRLVRVRMRRQQVLDRDGLQLSVVLDESVLKRRIGDEAVMYDQLQRLVKEADRPNLTLQVLPLDAQHVGLRGILCHLQLRAGRRCDAAGRGEHRAPEKRIHPGRGAGYIPAPDRISDAFRSRSRSGGVQGAYPRDGGGVLVRCRQARPCVNGVGR